MDQTFPDWLRESLTLLIALTMILLPTLLIWKKIAARYITILIFAIASSAFIINIDMVQSLQVGSMVAKMKNTVRKADATLAQLRDVASFLTNQTLYSALLSMRIEKLPRQEWIILRNDTISKLKKLGATDAQIRTATERADAFISAVILNDIQVAISEEIATIPNSSERNRIESNMQTFLNTNREFSSEERVDSEALRKYIKSTFKVSDRVDSLLKDLVAFQATGEIRDPDVFYKTL